MHRRRYLVALIALALLVFSSSAGTADAAVCADHPNQASAQRAKDTRDADGDGIYCESLPCPCLRPGQGGGGSSRSPRARRQAVKAVRCGVERWNVKTTKDKRASLIALDPVPSSVNELRRLDVPVVGRHDPRISGVETTVFGCGRR